MMTRIGQMIFNDGYAKGFKEGFAEVITENMERESERIYLLIMKLLDENRLDDLQRMTEDEKFMEQLMREFNIS